MIKTEHIGASVLKITAPEILKGSDFLALTPEVETLIKEQGKIRLLIDASNLTGWANPEAVEQHMRFVKNHQAKVERIAVIIRHDWQHWLVSAVRIFLHPEVKAFDRAHEADAMRWIAG